MKNLNMIINNTICHEVLSSSFNYNVSRKVTRNIQYPLYDNLDPLAAKTRVVLSVLSGKITRKQSKND